MKNFTLVFITIISVLTISCDSDDTSQDPIVGVWTLSERFQNESLIELTNCTLKNAIIAMPDGTFESKFYRQGNDTTCELYLESSGTWENLGDNKYTLIEEGKDPYASEIRENKDGDIFSLEDSFEFQGNTIMQKELFTKL